jgi:hypothetical protein
MVFSEFLPRKKYHDILEKAAICHIHCVSNVVFTETGMGLSNQRALELPWSTLIG